MTQGEPIRRQSALKSAVTLCQPVMESGDDLTPAHAAAVREMVKVL